MGLQMVLEDCTNIIEKKKILKPLALHTQGPKKYLIMCIFFMWMLQEHSVDILESLKGSMYPDNSHVTMMQ